VLQPGGLLSLAVPDAEAVLTAYAPGDHDFFELQRRWHPNWCDPSMHHINYVSSKVNRDRRFGDYQNDRLNERSAGR